MSNFVRNAVSFVSLIFTMFWYLCVKSHISLSFRRALKNTMEMSQKQEQDYYFGWHNDALLFQEDK